MSVQNQTPKKFKPERPIYLNEENTGYRTKIEVLHAIEQLRDLGWLCTYSENSRPIHMSFNNEKDVIEFKRSCKDLDIKLKSKIIKQEDLEELELKENEGQIIPGAESTSSHEDPSGKVHIE